MRVHPPATRNHHPATASAPTKRVRAQAARRITLPLDARDTELALYDDAGLLHHVGFTSNIKADEKPALTKKLEKLVGEPGFTGNRPGGPSRWSTERSGEWESLETKLVVEVQYDHFSGGRFRHGTRFLRWRPDKAPRQCTLKQVAQESGAVLDLLQ